MREPVTTMALELLALAGWPVAVVTCPVVQFGFGAVPGGQGGKFAVSGSGVGAA